MASGPEGETMPSRQGRIDDRICSDSRVIQERLTLRAGPYMTTPPVALAKSRIWRGFITAKGSLLTARAATKANCQPPVASSTISVGCSWRSWLSNSPIPVLSLVTFQRVCAGRQAISSRPFETSMPIKRGGRFFIGRWLLSVRPSLANASLGLGQLFGLIQEEA
jgi:hypothetical protein